MRTVLVIDDESGIRSAVKDILEDEKYRVLTAEDGIVGLSIMREERVDLVLLDIWLPRRGGMDVLKDIKATWADVEVVIISGHANIDMAVQAVKLGAFDFIEKPLSIDRIITATRNALAIGVLKEENRKLRGERASAEPLVAESKAMKDIIAVIKQSAASDARVLITGENGTGKELAAREIHRLSARATRPFIEVNCAAIPESLIESELFGHEKGAFTDAVSRRKGKFEAADGGTIFLDEIADMSLQAQAKVLRAIQELKFERVGSEESISVDVRVIAATNKDLKAEIEAGRFREDLFFRLNVIPFKMPSLRERAEDIPVLVKGFVEGLGTVNGQPPKSFSSEALAALAEHPWPGNVRELKNIVERVSVMSDEEPVSRETVEHFLSRSGNGETPRPEPRPEAQASFGDLKLGEAKDAFEKKYIEQKLRECGYNISKTAEVLGVYASNLHAKLKKYGIQIER
jgi:two-component system, NtrC family, nitrogen regulation response regulator NtrX